uniref:Uncharacterized protein n=1 Tax=Rheinheimera sp. BAL341 TaxID=1708203 RepID=A0A486XGK8_9GAMM
MTSHAKLDRKERLADINVNKMKSYLFCTLKVIKVQIFN